MFKTVDVTAREWFDKVNGNSYFAARVTLDFGMETERSYILPFQYGYGDHYRDVAFKLLQENGEIPQQPPMTSHWRYYDENNVIARHVKYENCKKRELLELA